MVTLNLFGVHGDWPQRRSVVADGFRRLRPDVVSLQDVVTSDSYDQVIDVVGLEYHVAHQSGRASD